MDDVRARAATVRLAVFDIDGVFTDGRIWIGSDGVEYKAFSVRDGYGVKAILAAACRSPSSRGGPRRQWTSG